MNRALDFNLCVPLVLCHCRGANSSTEGTRAESSALVPAQTGVTRSLLAPTFLWCSLIYGHSAQIIEVFC